MSTLYMIRHGKASFGKENYDKLSETGIEQSQILARYFNTLGVSFDAVISGTLERHRETAAPWMELAPGSVSYEEWGEFDEYRTREVFSTFVPILLEERPEMRRHIEAIFTSNESFLAVLDAVMDMWLSEKYDSDGMESWKGFVARVYRGIDRIMNEKGGGKTVAVFTSGGPVSVAVRRALGLDDRQAMRLRNEIVNTAFSRFKYNEENFTLTGFNCYPHLEIEKRDGLVTYR